MRFLSSRQFHIKSPCKAAKIAWILYNTSLTIYSITLAINCTRTVSAPLVYQPSLCSSTDCPGKVKSGTALPPGLLLNKESIIAQASTCMYTNTTGNDFPQQLQEAVCPIPTRTMSFHVLVVLGLRHTQDCAGLLGEWSSSVQAASGPSHQSTLPASPHALHWSQWVLQEGTAILLLHITTPVCEIIGTD